MANHELISGLNHQLNREISTSLRYMLQAAAIKGAANEPVRDMYLEEVLDEVGHAQYLANQIVNLGGTPLLEPDLTAPPVDVETMLRNDAQAEREDMDNYAQLASLAEDEGLIGLKITMEEQGADEDEHRQKIQRMLG